jgi:protease PrsW
VNRTLSEYNDLRLLTPPKEEEEIYPYRRVWRSIIIESSILLGLMLNLYLLWQLFGVRLPDTARFPINILLALTPALLWVMISWLPEKFAVSPRPRLFTVFIVSALVANAVAIPILNTIFQLDTWLPQQGTINRILGHMLTVGILQEFLKYVVVRYIAYPQHYRVRADSVAYCVASAIGYATVFSLSYVVTTPMATADAAILRVFGITAMNIAGSVVIAYGLSETWFSDALAFLLPAMLLFASLVVGLSMTMRTEFSKAALGLTISEQRTIFGMAVVIVLYAGPMAVMLFLFNVSDQRERDRFASEEI